jgi:hypothetical protein
MCRKKPEYVLLVGLWSGTKKPQMAVFLETFVKAVRHLADNGLSVSTPSGKLKFKLLVVAGTLDLVAKAPALNMIQFNGMYGCPKCLQKGRSVSTGGGHSHVYPYNRNNPSGPPRSERTHKRHSSEALSTSQTVSKIYVSLCLRSNALRIICV